jgi:protein-tyrosine phosphatase
MASILVVCTGNICRSPMAEGFLREQLRQRFPEQPAEVSGAGVIARDGHPATDEAVEAALEREVDISGHRARRLRHEQIQGADLILGMAEEHTEEIARLVPDAAPRTFTLKELINILKDLPPAEELDRLDDASLAARIREADALRSQRGLRTMDMDISDPLGMSLETYRATAWELDTLVAQLVEGLAGKLPARQSMWDDE